MEVVRDTPLEHGITYWAIEPPRASMIVVVKVTFDLRPNGFELAPTQPPVTGETFWDDDPQRSVRWPTDLAILKPRGECFVVGCARPLTGRPETQTTASFAIGAVRKSFAVFGDRTWSGDAPSAPTPFTEMPISWERTFGGPGIDDNPLGTSLPNVQLPGEHVTRRGERVRRPAPGRSA